MVFLVPVTLPSGAQAAHTSVTDEHAYMEKFRGTRITFSQIRPVFLPLICSHAVNSQSFQKYVTHSDSCSV